MTSSTTSPSRATGWLLLALTIGLLGIARWLFPLAQPTIALDQRLTTATAIDAARAFATARGLPIEGAEVAVRFEQDGATQTFVELEGGGKAAVDTIVRGRDVALFSWQVRFYRPGDPREVRVTLAPDGRVIGFRRTLAERDERPRLDSTAAHAVADSVRAQWLDEPASRWRTVAVSEETVQPGNRLDRTFTFERTDRRIGAAPLRLDVVVRGDLPGGAAPYVKVPEAFERRYAERRADNELYATIASGFVPIIVILGLVAMGGAGRAGGLRWRPAAIAAAVIGGLAGVADLNALSLSWFDYDTATSTGTHLAMQGLGSLVTAVGLGLVSWVLLAMGEWLTRDAFPAHFDWWQTARYAGTRPIAGRVLGGYTVAAFGFAYVSVFYYLTSRALGWWSPSGLLDDPNQIATPFPWVSAVATSLQAGVLEEVLFRAVPLALVARWTRGRSWQRPAMAAAVVATALIFGFAHANYASWPAYARGVELFLEAVLWAVLYLRVGMVTTVVAHFTYDLVLFALFAAAGSAWPYRVSLGAVVLVGALPALWVAWRVWRQRGLAPEAPASARFGAFVPMGSASDTGEFARRVPVAGRGAARVGGGAVLAGIAALVVSAWPARPIASPRFTATRAQVATTADSLLRALGADPAQWRRMVDAQTVGAGQARRFLVENGASPALLDAIGRTWLHGAQWSVRYVRTTGSVAERTESWEIALDADGRPHTWEHTIPDSLAAPDIAQDSAVALARLAWAAAAARPAALVLVSAEATARPARRDVLLTFDDTTHAIPAGGAVRRTAVVAGDRVVRIGHTVFIPEAWSRATTETQTRRGSITFGIVTLAVLAWLAGLVVVMRRAPLEAGLRWPPRRTLFAVWSVAALLTVLVGLNGWESALHGWDTTTPWDRHGTFVALGLAGGALGPAGLYLLWRAADAARRRIGLPLEHVSGVEALRGGAVLVLAATILSALPAWATSSPPQVPGTALDTAVPWAAFAGQVLSGGLARAAGGLLVGAAAFAIRDARWRALVLVLMGALLAVALTGSAATDARDWAWRAGVQAVALLGAVAVLWRWGRQPLESYAVAGLLAALADAVTGTITAATGQDAAAHLVSMLPAVALLVWLVRRPRAVPAPSPA